MSVSNAAFSKGRAKILHTAFIELNQKALCKVTYSHKELYKRYGDFRLLAIDGSKVRLPHTKEIKDEFGSIPFANQLEKTKGNNTFALASVLYDVENHIALDASINSIKKGEKDLAISHLKYIKKHDLLLLDRGYGSYELMSKILDFKGNFVIRLSKQTFKVATEMFKDDTSFDITTDIYPHIELQRKHNKKEINIRKKIKIRFVKVILDNNEIEVLATSLTDTEKYPRDIFKEIYWKRWKVETFFSKLKTRLELENFTGKSVESVKQDFYSSVFLCGLESILTEDTDIILKEKENVTHIQKVNKAVSFNAIKDRAFDILFEEEDINSILSELEALFIMNPSLERKKRNTPRKKSIPRKLIHFLKRGKKYVF